MFAAIETLARRICRVNPNRSSSGNPWLLEDLLGQIHRCLPHLQVSKRRPILHGSTHAMSHPKLGTNPGTGGRPCPESGNKDIHSRGILLHGWDPYNPTSGCLGVSGNIQTRKRGSRTLGLPPPYLDQLKKGILKDGGVLVYNFTPNKKDLSKN